MLHVLYGLYVLPGEERTLRTRFEECAPAAISSGAENLLCQSTYFVMCISLLYVSCLSLSMGLGFCALSFVSFESKCWRRDGFSHVS